MKNVEWLYFYFSPYYYAIRRGGSVLTTFEIWTLEHKKWIKKRFLTWWRKTKSARNRIWKLTDWEKNFKRCWSPPERPNPICTGPRTSKIRTGGVAGPTVLLKMAHVIRQESIYYWFSHHFSPFKSLGPNFCCF